MNLKISKVHEKEKKQRPNQDSPLGFGKFFSDHMFTMEYSDGKWSNAEIRPFENFSLNPATMVFHYGQGIFEGLKAYKTNDNLYLFRPQKNMERMNNSAKRLVMPTFDNDFVLNALSELVKLDQDWIPTAEGQALYIRPTMIATEPFLGVRSSSRYLFFIITGPVGAYYENGLNPVDIYVTSQYVRAVKGGVGQSKVIGNYAASLLAQQEGQERYGCNQVLWLDGIKHQNIEEVGSMNIFVRFKNELVTPFLSGAILPGVTRDSVIAIAKKWGIPVNERTLSINEVIEGIQNKEVLEVFGTGTAAVISPVGSLTYNEKKYAINNGQIGELSSKLYNFLTKLQRGLEEDSFDFLYKL